MSTEPLAEAYEKLKELRRQGELPEQAIESQMVLLRTGQSLRTQYSGVSVVGLGLTELIGRIDTDNGRLTRLLEIVPLADRIFGDEQKAEIWLNRPNPSFSWQKPIDLLEDELGAAVVREALEQIDHGIFS